MEVIKKCDPTGEGVITKEAFIAFNKMTHNKTFWSVPNSIIRNQIQI
mgnify:CR=1 FL=1